MSNSSSEKVFELKIKDIDLWGTIKFVLFWVCVILLYFCIPALSIVISVLMVSTIRVRKVDKSTFELEYGIMPLIRRWSNGKENTENKFI